MNYYIPEHFILEEWLPEVFFNTMYPLYGKKLWLIFDWKTLYTADLIRKRYGLIVMNTWHSQKMIEAYGRHEWRGYRDHTSQYVQKGSTFPFGNISQHRFGRAEDLVPLRTTAEVIRGDILADPYSETFKYITCIEADVSWLHVDTRNHDKENKGILIV